MEKPNQPMQACKPKRQKQTFFLQPHPKTSPRVFLSFGLSNYHPKTTNKTETEQKHNKNSTFPTPPLTVDTTELTIDATNKTQRIKKDKFPLLQDLLHFSL